MAYSKKNEAGVLFFFAVTQFVLGLTVAEALYPGYNISGQYISDLGIGPSSAVFNSSVFLLGALILIGVFLLRGFPGFKTLNVTLLLMAVWSMGVGVFTKSVPAVHGAVSLAAFFFAGLSAMASIRVVKMPLSLISAFLGLMTLGALALFSAGMVTSGSLTSSEAFDSAFYLSLGPGGMERMIVYPPLMWLATFGGHLLSRQET
jgi:hypothetical membrane protein